MYVIKSNRKTNSYTVRKINRITQVVRVGRRGLQGETGATGPQGPKGDQGDPATNLVQSVNGKQGVVVLNATDVGADPTGSASQALQDAKDYTDTEVSTLDSSLATVAKTGSYNDLGNKPTIPSIAGLATEAQVQDVQDNLYAHEADTANPHSVTKAQVGLGNVDNTSDLDKPISIATQTALDRKATKLNVNQFTMARRMSPGPGEVDTQIQAIASRADANSVAVRTATGAIKGDTAVTNDELVPKAQMDAKTDIEGTGFPNGVISAPVGRTYKDLNATNGAVVWTKMSGTGNTGWVVSVGDTGWRNISADVTNGWTGGLRISRTNNMVYISAGRYSLTGAAATADTFYTLPLGFRASGSGNYGFIGVAGVGPSIPTMELVQVDRITYLVSCRARNQISGDWSFLTANAWPSTLPGVSA